MAKWPEPKILRQGETYYIAETFPPHKEKWPWAVITASAGMTTMLGKDRAFGLASSEAEAIRQALAARMAIMERDRRESSQQ